MRHFIPWGRPQYVEDYYLPQMIQKIQGSVKVPIGDAVLSTPDTCIGMETCEELFCPQSPHIEMRYVISNCIMSLPVTADLACLNCIS